MGGVGTILLKALRTNTSRYQSQAAFLKMSFKAKTEIEEDDDGEEKYDRMTKQEIRQYRLARELIAG